MLVLKCVVEKKIFFVLFFIANLTKKEKLTKRLEKKLCNY